MELVLAVPLSGSGGILVVVEVEDSPLGKGGKVDCDVVPSDGAAGALAAPLGFDASRPDLWNRFMLG